MKELLIVGGGPAGLTAALYSARAGIRPVVLERLPGGRLAELERVDNYPGFAEGVTGPELAAAMRAQAERFGVEFRTGESLTGVEPRPDGSFLCETDFGESLAARALVLCAGTEPVRLDVPGEARWFGRGVSACVTCDGAFFKGRDVILAGGGAEAVAGAFYLARLCRSVLVAPGHPGGSPAVPGALARAKALPNVEWLGATTRIAEILPREDGRGVGAVRLTAADGTETVRPVDGLFECLGTAPAVRAFASLVALGPDGGVQADPATGVTSRPGIFAAGDVLSGAVRQIAWAVGTGCAAALSAVRWLHRSSPSA